MMPNTRLSFPSVNDLLESPPLKSLLDRVSHNVVVAKARRFLDDMRSQVQSAAANVPAPAELAQRIADWISAEQPSAIVPVINATGLVVNDELGGVPLADQATAAMVAQSHGYTNQQLNLITGERSAVDREVEDLLIRHTGAQAALITNSQTTALWLALASLSVGREVIVSRSHLIEITDGCRLHDLVRSAGAVVRETGSVNRTTADDYATAITPQSGALLHVVSSKCAAPGLPKQLSLAELSVLPKRDLPLVAWMDSCAWIDLARYGLIGEPLVSQMVDGGADLIVLPGDRFLGSVSCGIILGRRDVIAQIKSYPLVAAIAADRFALAGLAATLRLYDDLDLAERSVPLLSLIATPLDNLRQRAERLAPQINARGVAAVEIIASQSPLAASTAVHHELPSVSIGLTPIGRTADQLARALRSGTPPVVAGINAGRVLLNMRSVFPRDDLMLMAAIEALGAEKSSQSTTTPTA